MDDIRAVIESAFERRGEISPGRAEPAVKDAVTEAIALLDSGQARVAEPRGGGWIVNEWLKKAVLLSFRIDDSYIMEGGFTRYFDKVPTKYATMDDAEFRVRGVRVVPPAVVRRGAWCAPGVVLMPSYVNLGAYVDSGTMVDTWATVGSCAQIGKNVHLSGGVGIGGVLEPLQASPTIIEDDCFIGARSEIVEGVVVERGSVISMGVYIGRSTRIYDRESGEVSFGRVPAGSVVSPATCRPTTEVRPVLRGDRESASTSARDRRWASTSCCGRSESGRHRKRERSGFQRALPASLRHPVESPPGGPPPQSSGHHVPETLQRQDLHDGMRRLRGKCRLLAGEGVDALAGLRAGLRTVLDLQQARKRERARSPPLDVTLYLCAQRIHDFRDLPSRKTGVFRNCGQQLGLRHRLFDRRRLRHVSAPLLD